MSRIRWFILAFTVIALVACYLPWFAHTAEAVSPNALDIAEWITLTPAARNQTLPLVSSLPLRLAVGFALVTLTLEAIQTTQLLLRAGLSLIIVAGLLPLLPPAEFLTSASADLNYRQQLLVAIVTFAGVIIGIIASPAWRQRMEIIVVALGGVCGIWGTIEGHTFFGAIALPGNPGSGAVMYIGAMAVLVVIRTRGMIGFRQLNKKPERG